MTAPPAASAASPNPPSKTAAWFHARVIKPRLIAAYIWATLATPLAGGVALALLGAKDGLFGIVFSLAPYRLLLWTAVGVSLFSYVSLRHSSLSRATPRVRSSRVGVLFALLWPGALGGVALQAALGAAVVKSVVGVAAPAFDNLAFRSLVSSDGGEEGEAATGTTTTPETTLHEGAVFVVASGFFAALRIGLDDVLSESAPFPSAAGVRLRKMIRIRKGLLPNLLASLREAFASMRWFFVFYFFAGNFIKDSLVCPLFASGQVCANSPSQIPMNSLLGVTEVGILWKSFVAVSFLIFSRKLVKSIVTAYINECLSFPVVEAAIVASDGQPTLTATLKPVAGDDVPPLAQLLAFQHLLDVLRDGPATRKPFFSLSQPGGHPHAWNAVSSACCDHLRGVLNGVVECNAAAAANNPGKPTASSGVMRLSPLRYLLQEFPGAKARKVFVESSKSIFAVSSLSHLVSASFEEDDFGVVQKKLADILDLLVSLYDAVEKNIKLFSCNGGLLAGSASSANNGRGTTLFGSAVIYSDVDGADILATARPALRDASKAAIYRIVVTFGNHLFGIHGLTPETSKRLKSFVDVKE